MKKYFQFLDSDGEIEGSVIAETNDEISNFDEMNIDNAWFHFYHSKNYDGFDGFVDLLNNNFPKIQFERFYFDNVFSV